MNFLKNHLKPHITEVITHIGIASFPNINLHQHCSQLKQWAYNAPILSINAQKGKLSMAQNIKRLQHGVPPLQLILRLCISYIAIIHAIR